MAPASNAAVLTWAAVRRGDFRGQAAVSNRTMNGHLSHYRDTHGHSTTPLRERPQTDITDQQCWIHYVVQRSDAEAIIGDGIWQVLIIGKRISS